MKRAALLVAALCAFVAAPAFAGPSYGTVRVQYTGLIRGTDLSMVSSASWGTVAAAEDVGLQQLQFTDLNLGGPGTIPIPADSYFNLGYTEAFCIDLWDNNPVGPDAPYLYDAVPLDAAPDPYAVPTLGGMGATKAGFIAKLLTNDTFETAEKAAAMQVAIWEIIDENYGGGTNPWNVSAGQGNFYLDTVGGTHGEAAIAALANTMLSNLSTTGLPFDPYTALSNGPGIKNVQDYMVVPDSVVVPVPGAAVLALLGIGVIHLGRRRSM
jgi:hypothetical protein